MILPLPVHDPVGETSNALHHFQSPFSIKCLNPSHFNTSQLQSLHVECPVLSYFFTFQLRPCHIGCPDPGHSTKIMCEDWQPVPLQLIFIVLDVLRIFIVLLVCYSVCVDGPGSLSGSAFNQLKLVTLNIVLTILY